MSGHARIAAILADCYDDPALFSHAVIGNPPLWWRQVEILRALVRYKTVVVETGNSIGKSFLLGRVVAPWWLFTRPDPLIVATAPSQTLLGTVLFKELRTANRTSRVPLGLKITDSPNASPQLASAPGRSMIGLATRGVERLSGQHNPNLLHLVDEGSGIEEEIADALDSQNPAKAVVCGNPLRAEGWFASLAQRGERELLDATIPDHQKTVTIRIPSTDSPDIHMPRSHRGLADAGFLAEARRQHGEASLWYRTHILAIRPDQSHDQLVPPAWLDACCVAARPEGVPPGPRRMSADLGEGVGRDKSVVCVRDDLGVLAWSARPGMGLPETAAEMARLARLWQVREDRITFDGLGIGRDLPLYLQQNGITEAVAYKGSYSGGADFTNLRGASAWAFRRRIDPGSEGFAPFAIPADEHWPHVREEVLVHRYDLVGQATRLEPKEDVCKRLGHSPDYADALFQSFAMGG